MAGRSRRALAFAIVVTALAFVALTLVARAQPVTNMPRLVLAVGAPYVALAAVVVLVLTLWRKRIVLSLFAVLLVAASVAIQVSWYYLGRPTDFGPHAEMRVLSSNIRRGQADAQSFVELATANADVITVAELTAESVQRFKAAGIDAVFPHSHLSPGPEASGIGIWSRYPLIALSPPRHRGAYLPAARVQLPGVRFDPVVAAEHVFSPLAYGVNNVDGWRNDMVAAKARMDDLTTAAGPGAVIIGGDFNSTPDIKQFRDLLTDGYLDAVQQSGSGFAPTFPSNTWYPPVLAIDHVLTRRAAAGPVRKIAVAGSDHRALLVTVRVPLDPDAQ